MNPISIKKFPGGYESESYVVKLKDVKYVLKFQRLSTHHHLTLEHYKIQNEVLLHLEK